MVVPHDSGRARLETGGAGRRLRKPGAGGGRVEHLHDAGAQRTAVLQGLTQRVGGGDAPLAVGGAGQGDADLAARHLVHDLVHVARGPDVRVRGPQGLVHQQASGLAAGQAGLPGQLQLRPDPDGQQDHASGNPPAVRELHLLNVRMNGLEADPGAARAPRAPPAAGRSGFRTPGPCRTDPGQELHDGGRDPAFGEGLRHLQPDETPARNYGRGGFLLFEEIVNRSMSGTVQRLKTWEESTPGRGREGCAALGEDERVVVQPGLSAGFLPGPAARAVDLQGFGADQHLDAVAAVEPLRGLQQELERFRMSCDT